MSFHEEKKFPFLSFTALSYIDELTIFATDYFLVFVESYQLTAETFDLDSRLLTSDESMLINIEGMEWQN